MQIPILDGIYTDEAADIRVAYPRNLIPVPQQSGISSGYLRPAYGLVSFGPLPGLDRGAINWNGVLYRVAGASLVQVAESRAYTVIGAVDDDGAPVSFDYSFTHLAVCSAGKMYLWDGTTFQQITDPDLGTVIDLTWLGGYFVFTDGEAIGVTELNDPTAVNPLKYGSSEVDPDRIVGLRRLRNELHVINRYTVEVFQNVGGENFPFQRIEGAQVTRGAVGTHAFCLYTIGEADGVAFVGGGRNESPSVYFSRNGQAVSLATDEIDQLLRGYTDAQLAACEVEFVRNDQRQWLMVHLPDRTLVYDADASAQLKQPVWFVLTSSVIGSSRYRARHFVWVYGNWVFGDTNEAQMGTYDGKQASHYGAVNGWDFGTVAMYGGAGGYQVHVLELVALTGRTALGDDPVVWHSYSRDGENFSQERPVSAGRIGQRDKRLQWRREGIARQWRLERFRGTSDAFLSVLRLEAELEKLSG